jgi:Kef-type K+ transport system membrane component KefB
MYLVMEREKRAATWRIVLAAILDFLTAFFVLGFLIASVSGGMTEDGFQLNGLPALVLFVAVFLYFWAGKKYFGGTLWKRILKAQ